MHFLLNRLAPVTVDAGVEMAEGSRKTPESSVYLRSLYSQCFRSFCLLVSFEEEDGQRRRRTDCEFGVSSGEPRS